MISALEKSTPSILLSTLSGGIISPLRRSAIFSTPWKEQSYSVPSKVQFFRLEDQKSALWISPLKKQFSNSLQLKYKRAFFLIWVNQQFFNVALINFPHLYLQPAKLHDKKVAPRPQIAGVLESNTLSSKITWRITAVKSSVSSMVKSCHSEPEKSA